MKDAQQPERDRHLDTPSEANRDKHINFVEAEDTDRNQGNTDKLTDRQKEWRQGIAEGEEERQRDGEQN
jgi:hypothetical protein